MSTKSTVRINVNGTWYERQIESRVLLSDFIRHDLGLTGTHVGCEHGICGACTIQLDGQPVRSCLTFAVQAEGKEIRTVEALAAAENVTERKNSIGNVEEARPSTEALSVLQAAFWENQGLQCGFCTAGILMSMDAFLNQNPDPTREQVREVLSGHICRCTGYHDIVDSVMAAAKVTRSLAKEGASSRDLLRRAYIAE